MIRADEKISSILISRGKRNPASITCSCIAALLILLALHGCGDSKTMEEGFDFKLVEVVPLAVDGFALSTPLMVPDIEYGGVYVAGGNSIIIYRYDPVRGLEKFIEPVASPPDMAGIGAFCPAEGDFFVRPSAALSHQGKPSSRLYQMTRGGRMRVQELPDEIMEDVQDFGILVYLGDGRVLIETDPKGPFAIYDFVANEVERAPTGFPVRESVDRMVADYGAMEAYVMRRAVDKSVYFLRFPFKGGYRGVEYIQRREFFAGAETVEGVHLVLYAVGMVDTYDFMYNRLATCELGALTEKEYSMMLDLAVVDNLAYVIGAYGPGMNPDGYDLLVFELLEVGRKE